VTIGTSRKVELSPIVEVIKIIGFLSAHSDSVDGHMLDDGAFPGGDSLECAAVGNSGF
jgi:hypothetical protein